MIDCLIEPSPGVNRPSGGSSGQPGGLLFTFVRSMLYGMGGRGDTDMRAKLRPLPQNGRYVKYGGEITYDACGRRFRLTRLFGSSAGDDVIELIDLDSGRDVKIEAGRTPGEKSLRLTEGAFVTAACLHLPPDLDFVFDPVRGGRVLGTLSCMGSLNDGKPSPYEITERLRGRLASVTDPSTQSGELDKAVIRKMSMRNELSRIGEIDNKISARSSELQAAVEERDTIRTSLNQDRRTNMLSKAAKCLLAKDRVMAEYERLTQLLRELDVRNSERGALSGRKITRALVPSIVVLAAGALLAAAGAFGAASPAGIAAIAAGAVLLAAGLIMLPLAAAKHKNRFYIKRDGMKVLLDDEIARLKQEISGRNAEIIKLLGDKTADEADEEWRAAEILMRNATDDERRFAVLKMSDDRNDAPGDDGRLDTVNEKIAVLQAEIDELCKSFGRSFSTASLALEGIDDDIKRLNDEAEAVRLSLLAADAAEEKFRRDILPDIIKGARTRYKNAFGEEPVFKCSGKFELITSAENAAGAYCAFIAASSDAVFGESRNCFFADETDGGNVLAEVCGAMTKLDGSRIIFI